MRESNVTFDTYHALAQKTPKYLVKFDAEDLENQYTETDVVADRLSISATEATFSNLDADEEVRESRDFGFVIYDGSQEFTHTFDFEITAVAGDVNWSTILWQIADEDKCTADLDTDSDYGFQLWFNHLTDPDVYKVHLFYVYNSAFGGSTPSYVSISLNTRYYVTMKFDPAVSTYGTIYTYLYTDSDRTTLLGSMSRTLPATAAFRYVHFPTAYNSGTSGKAVSGDVNNLVLGPDYVTHKAAGAHHQKAYLGQIKGAGQRVTPEEGKASISGLTIPVLDYDDEVTKRIAGDPTYMHRRKVTIKAGYQGMDESDMLTVQAGWITGMSLSADGLFWEFSVTDPQKWMQRKIFRGATEDVPVTVSGNPVNIFLQCMISTGNATEGTYDTLAAANALAIGTDYINITNIELVRDDWYAGMDFEFNIKKPIVAKRFFEQEIFKVLNVYPMTDADGKVNIKPLKPPLVSTSVQTFNEDNIIGIPKYDPNLGATLNECEFHYDWEEVDDDKFDVITLYVDADSLNDRGPGNKSLVVKSKGIRTARDGANLIGTRKNRIFQRWAIPPPRISFSAFFSRWLSEAGDVVPVTHPLLPDLESGVRGYTAERMEVINRSVDWKNGKVKFDLLATGFARNKYCVISPAMTVTSGTSTTVFDVSSADAAKYEEGWVIDIFYANMVAVATDLEITDITGTQITVGSSIGATPAAGWICQFSSYDNLSADQKDFWALSDGSDYLGAADDDAHLLVA